MATTSFKIGPQDGWVQVLTSTAKASFRLSAFPHTHPFYVYTDPSVSPTDSTQGILVCHHPFEADNYTSTGNIENVWIKVVNPGNQSGKVRIDVHVDTSVGSGGGSGGVVSTTGTLSQVASSATAVTILAANTSRKGASIFNSSTQTLFLGLSNTTPTSSVYSVAMVANSYFEVPAGYNGIIKGIWASANGNAVIAEYT